jgi:hypothetical protein
MIEAFSTLPHRNRTFILFAVCGVLAITAVAIGINDNPPGLLLAYLSAIAFVLAFVHPWRTVRKYMFLLLASLLGFVLFVIGNIIFDSIAHNPTTPVSLQDLIQSPAVDALNMTLALLCPAAFMVGAVGSLVTFIRNRRTPA